MGKHVSLDASVHGASASRASTTHHLEKKAVDAVAQKGSLANYFWASPTISEPMKQESATTWS